MVGNQTILTLTEDTVYEFSILSNSSVQMLHSIKIDGGIVLPPQYSSKTDTVVVLTKDNNLQYIKMNEAKS